MQEIQDSLQRDFQTIFNDFSRLTSIPPIPPTLRGSQMMENPHPPKEPAAKSTTPKSAIDRLLEDDLLGEEEK